MPLTAYEKFNVEAGKEVIVKGMVKFNCLNHTMKPKPTKTEPDPAPRTTIELINPLYYGDTGLAHALDSKKYASKDSNEEPNRISLINKGNFLPALFDKSGEQIDPEELIPDGKRLDDDQIVLVHVRSFSGKNNNVGASFDSVKFATSFDDVKLASVGVSADVFDDLGGQVEM